MSPNPIFKISGGVLNKHPKILVLDNYNILGWGFDSYITFETTFKIYSTEGQPIEEHLYSFFKKVEKVG